jgi:hypothetical protein
LLGYYSLLFEISRDRAGIATPPDKPGTPSRFPWINKGTNRAEVGVQIPLSQILIEQHAIELRKQRVEEYEKKHRNKVAELIKQAEAWNKKALLKLIEIDKSFMFEPWAKKLILEVDHGDEIRSKRNFFRSLGKALIEDIKNKRDSPYKDKIDTLKLLYSKTHPFGKAIREILKIPEGREIILQSILNRGFLPLDEFSDSEYFMKFLRRNKIID